MLGFSLRCCWNYFDPYRAYRIFYHADPRIKCSIKLISFGKSLFPSQPTSLLQQLLNNNLRLFSWTDFLKRFQGLLLPPKRNPRSTPESTQSSHPGDDCLPSNGTDFPQKVATFGKFGNFPKISTSKKVGDFFCLCQINAYLEILRKIDVEVVRKRIQSYSVYFDHF